MEDLPEQQVVEVLQGAADASSVEAIAEPGKLDQGSMESGDGKGEDVSSVDPVPISNIEESLERLLQRQRSEIMFELRRLQYGERPVTGQEQRRRTVENLVLRAVRPTAPPRSSGPRSASDRPLEGSTTNEVSEAAPGPDVNRPEQIIVEVNALVERRPVSSILHSLQFRRQLENSVRGALQTMRGGLGQGGTRRIPTVQSNGNPSVVSTEIVPDVQRMASDAEERSPSDLSIRSESPQASASAVAMETPAVAMATGHNASPHPSLPVPENSSGAARAEEWIRQYMTDPSQPDPLDGVRQRQTFDILNRMHHEEFVMEISDLIHRQLVTSTLNGSFRDVLERRMRRDLESRGIDGARVQEHLRQLPRSNGRLRNDFVDLGIISGAAAAAVGEAGEVGDAMDDVSVISATAAVAIPQVYTQNNVAMGRELHSLRTELQELKNMMRLSFDLQLDIQRSIRQEVAAALAQTQGGGSVPVPSTASASRRHPASSASNDRCLICDDHQVDTVLYQCGHLCLCYSCSVQLRQNGSNCPVCRAPIRDIMRTYRS